MKKTGNAKFLTALIIFSTTQAIWPVREKMMRAVRNLALPVFFMAVSFQRDGWLFLPLLYHTHGEKSRETRGIGENVTRLFAS